MISFNINMAKCATIMLVLQQIVQGQNEKNESIDNVCKNGDNHCCSGYYWHDGKCTECFGAIGLNCAIINHSDTDADKRVSARIMKSAINTLVAKRLMISTKNVMTLCFCM